jgi:hypothetical protein
MEDIPSMRKATIALALLATSLLAWHPCKRRRKPSAAAAWLWATTPADRACSGVGPEHPTPKARIAHGFQ